MENVRVECGGCMYMDVGRFFVASLFFREKGGHKLQLVPKGLDRNMNHCTDGHTRADGRGVCVKEREREKVMESRGARRIAGQFCSRVLDTKERLMEMCTCRGFAISVRQYPFLVSIILLC